MDKEAIKRMYADKKAYIENDLAAVLRAMPDFDSIKYAVDAATNEEYIKLTETLGFVYFVNVTGNSENAILKEVCCMVLERTPTGLVRSIEARREINKLFGGCYV